MCLFSWKFFIDGKFWNVITEHFWLWNVFEIDADHHSIFVIYYLIGRTYTLSTLNAVSGIFFCAREVHRKSREKNKSFTNVAVTRSLERFCKSLASAPRSTVHNCTTCVFYCLDRGQWGNWNRFLSTSGAARVRNIFFTQADNGLERAIHWQFSICQVQWNPCNSIYMRTWSRRRSNTETMDKNRCYTTYHHLKFQIAVAELEELAYVTCVSILHPIVADSLNLIKRTGPSIRTEPFIRHIHLALRSDYMLERFLLGSTFSHAYEGSLKIENAMTAAHEGRKLCVRIVSMSLYWLVSRPANMFVYVIYERLSAQLQFSVFKLPPLARCTTVADYMKFR